MANNHCNICGKNMKPSESTELLDGFICDECKEKLSPWFKEFDTAEVDEIHQQIRGRERNQNEIRNFHPTRKFGEKPMLVIDDDAKTFVVTDSYDLVKANPDIIRLEDVLDCGFFVDDNREKLDNGSFLYTYNFVLDIDLYHDYLDKIRMYLNSQPLELESDKRSFLGFGKFDPSKDVNYHYYQAEGWFLSDILNDKDKPFDVDNDPHRFDVKPGEFNTNGSPSIHVEHDVNEGNVVNCPWCGCKVKVTDTFRCPNCGGPL